MLRPLLPHTSLALSAARPSPAAKIADHLARGVMAGSAGDAAARMGRGAAHVEAGNGRAIVGVSEHGAGGIKLVETQAAMEDVAADEAEFALEVEARGFGGR